MRERTTSGSAIGRRHRDDRDPERGPSSDSGPCARGVSGRMLRFSHRPFECSAARNGIPPGPERRDGEPAAAIRSEEHTSELQSPCNLVCRLLLEKKKKNTSKRTMPSKHKSARYPASNTVK